jgi:hypothetical protein
MLSRNLYDDMDDVLNATTHRPWPQPEGPWVMAQIWHDLLFAHWPVDAAALRTKIPAPLEIDTFLGQAWMAVVPFRMSGVRLRWTPSLPWLSKFPELNVRTYVVKDGKPGVWFFSLDAGNFLAVAIARAWFHLPYFRARMSCKERNSWIHYESQRMYEADPEAILEARYRPIGEEFESRPGSLEHFLTERYCLCTADGEGRILRGEIHHPPWKLQMAEAEFTRNTMCEAAGIPLQEQKPLLHFARRQQVLVWAPRHLA